MTMMQEFVTNIYEIFNRLLKISVSKDKITQNKDILKIIDNLQKIDLSKNLNPEIEKELTQLKDHETMTNNLNDILNNIKSIILNLKEKLSK